MLPRDRDAAPTLGGHDARRSSCRRRDGREAPEQTRSRRRVSGWISAIRLESCSLEPGGWRLLCCPATATLRPRLEATMPVAHRVGGAMGAKRPSRRDRGEGFQAGSPQSGSKAVAWSLEAGACYAAPRPRRCAHAWRPRCPSLIVSAARWARSARADAIEAKGFRLDLR